MRIYNPAVYGSLRDVSWSQGGKYLAAGGDISPVIWDPFQAEEVTVLPEHDSNVMQIEFLPNGELLVTATTSDLFFWSVPDFERIHMVPGTNLAYYGTVSWSPNSEMLLVQGSDGLIHFLGVKE